MGHWDSNPVPGEYNTANALYVNGHFLTTATQYNYDRQAALYLDVLGATRFLIIGIQKKAPHEVWLFDTTAAHDFIAQGRKKYTVLLRHYSAQ